MANEGHSEHKYISTIPCSLINRIKLNALLQTTSVRIILELIHSGIILTLGGGGGGEAGFETTET
jgi:hypothetical protein